MNVKGLKLDKILAHKIYDSFDDISLQNLRGISTFNSFSWIGFSRDEFKNLLSLFVRLDETGFFDCVSDDHTFIFNYSTDVTEMDIVAVLKCDGKCFLLDIESKNGDDEAELQRKICQQIKKRKNNYLPQLLKGKNYITLGFVNNRFVDGYVFDGDKNSHIENESLARETLKNMSGYENQEEYLIQSSSLASIVKLCNDIQNGEYNFYEETNRLYTSLINKINIDDACIVYGNAGTGKSVLALKLFFENKNAKILIMNSKLYFAFSFHNKYYSNNRATFNSNAFYQIIDKETISIIDECQRLRIEDIVKIIQKSKITFLFGDHKQACFHNCTLESGKQLKELLTNEYKFNVSLKILKKSRRYNDEVNKALEYLTSTNANKPDCFLPSDYNIDVYYNESQFLDDYDKTPGIKKIYAPVYKSPEKLTIGTRVFTKAKYDDDKYSLWADNQDYYGITFHALSFDIDHCFVVLKSTKIIKIDGKNYIFHSNFHLEPKFDDIRIFLNELNVLFTRGRKSLKILAYDIETYLFLNSLVGKMKK